MRQRACWIIKTIAAVLIGTTTATSDDRSAPSGTETRIAVRGMVTYLGAVPPPVLVAESGRKRYAIERDAKTGGLKDAIVWLEGMPADGENVKAELPTVEMDQRDFLFLPRVLGVRAGQPVKFTNSDGANHGVQAISLRPENRFNLITGPSQEYVHEFVGDKYPVKIECSLHSWMSAWIFVFDHGCFAVTGADGRFKLPAVPPREYLLEIRHPESGMRRRQKVTVTADPADLPAIEFTDKDRPSAGK